MVKPEEIAGFVDWPNWCRFWLIIDFEVKITDTYKQIRVRTDRNLLLWLFYGIVGPVDERRIRMRRGAWTTRDPHKSFHPFGVIPQEEDYNIFDPDTWPFHPEWWHTFIVTREAVPDAEFWFHFEGHGCLRPLCPQCKSPDITCGVFDCICNSCSYEFKKYLSDWESVARSTSPFYNEKWHWTPLWPLLYYEPWSFWMWDPILLYHEPWSFWMWDPILLYHEPWST